jgi:hypothetical protein
LANVRHDSSPRGQLSGTTDTNKEDWMEQMTLGIDVACRVAHQASLADDKGRLVWSGRRFRTTVDDLRKLRRRAAAAIELTVVMEPTRNVGAARGLVPAPRRTGDPRATRASRRSAR